MTTTRMKKSDKPAESSQSDRSGQRELDRSELENVSGGYIDMWGGGWGGWGGWEGGGGYWCW